MLMCVWGGGCVRVCVQYYCSISLCTTININKDILSYALDLNNIKLN